METYNNGMLSGGRRPRLWLVRGDEAHKFTGESIPGVVQITTHQHEKNGKWSNTTYGLLLAPGVRPIRMESPLHGTWGDNLGSWTEVARKLAVSVETAKIIVGESYPHTASRLDDVEKFFDQNEEVDESGIEMTLSWGGGTARNREESWKLRPHLVDGEGTVHVFDGSSIHGVVQVLQDVSVLHGLRRSRCEAYRVMLFPGVSLRGYQVPASEPEQSGSEQLGTFGLALRQAGIGG